MFNEILQNGSQRTRFEKAFLRNHFRRTATFLKIKLNFINKLKEVLQYVR